MAWYDSTVFYHIYPLGLCGCGKENTGVQEHHFDKLKAWAEHAQELNFTAIYIGRCLSRSGMVTKLQITKKWTAVWEVMRNLRILFPTAMILA